MAVKKNNFKPTKKDLRIMFYMSKSGGISHAALLDRFGYSQKTIASRFSKLSCIQKNPEEEVVDGKVVTRYVYSLNAEGKDLMLKHNLNHHCCSYYGYEHLLKSEQELFRLVGRDEMFDSKMSEVDVPSGIVALEDIMGEAEQRFKHEANIELLKKEENMSVSVVDYLYKNSSGEYVAVEVETSNYRKERREAHSNYVKYVLGLNSDNYRIVK